MGCNVNIRGRNIIMLDLMLFFLMDLSYFCDRLVLSLSWSETPKTYEPGCEKTGLRGFRPGPTQTGLYSHRRWVEA